MPHSFAVGKTRDYGNAHCVSRVGLIAEIPDMTAFQDFMQTEAAADAMKADGVRPETLLVLDEG